MRGVVLLCMLHAAFVQGGIAWEEPSPTASTTDTNVCFLDKESCGCCLMQRQVQRMEEYFNISYEGMNKVLTQSRTALNNMRASRSAFSVALNSNKSLNCFGPFDKDTLIPYKYVFINLGDGYSAETGIFIAPRSGVYSLALTVYSDIDSSITPLSACADLQVNGHAVAVLPQQDGNDFEDSATVVLAVELKSGDRVAVNLPKGCLICDNNSHFNTFTGFLLYASD